MYIQTCMRTNVHTYIRTSMHPYTYTLIHLGIYIHIHIPIPIPVYMYMHICRYMYIPTHYYSCCSSVLLCPEVHKVAAMASGRWLCGLSAASANLAWSPHA